MSDDVGKRWDDPPTFRAAARFCVTVVAVAGAALFVYGSAGVAAAGLAVPGAFLVGGLVAFARTYRVWQSGGTWPIWQGAGFFCMVAFLMALPVAGSALTSR